MAKISCVIGYGESVEIDAGRWQDIVVEYSYKADLLRNNRHLVDGEKVNDDLSLSNSISIVADAYAREHFFAIRYVKWAEQYWTVPDVEVQTPRLILRLGGVYNGQKA